MATKKKNRSKKIIQIKTVIGLFCLLLGLILLMAFASFILHWQADQSQVEVLTERSQVAQNILGKLGAWLGNIFILNGVGIIAFILPVFFFLFALKILLRVKIAFGKLIFNTLFFALWLPIVLAFVFPNLNILSGVYGFEIKESLHHLIGSFGLALLLIFTFLIYVVFEYGLTIQHFYQLKEKLLKKSRINENEVTSESIEEQEKDYAKQEEETFAADKAPKENKDTEVKFTLNEALEEDQLSENNLTQNTHEAEETEEDVALTIEKIEEEETVDDDASAKLLKDFGEFDPTLDLPHYKVPPIHLLVSHNSDSNVTIDQKELEANKNKIVETLSHYKIGIAEIKATIGPTVTLYEIVPEAGIRISKIKNLEDDIALSLSALGIRIIAPIPGKGTIGIEVPNSHPSVVSMRSVIASQKFQNAQKMELPIAFGKTISNETFVADLAKMPHLLMAGATGQGKSVGLNAIITSLLYKKHPAEIKFVFVDPKKVELTLYNKIERHFLAKLPNTEEAIITDNQKVINTLNSLCIEMDDRYELLKNAYVRNIKEYNVKFKSRKLNPENGHRFLPYIVLVVDEFADLIMTAGKEVEGPIARLAQLARAIGIHLIIATQRPSVNVITGIIKANFPARVAFRVTSKIDSRTILDGGGADQLIGKGDMLFTNGNEMIRLQCAFVDTPEVEEITEFIGNQKGYPDALLLPEYEGEESSILDVDLDERDKLFDDAARVVVAAQQGSASLIQRKLKLGYNRAGRIIDQLEAAGIVGAFEGSKARQVLITDEMSLEQLLKDL